ncbi:MAG: DNA repair protein RecO [Phycisphaerae bacterium]|nr:DNA repair protein RecO [Phycisphaerae bacterium]
MLTKDQAICLRTVDYSETSQVVTLLCRRAGKLGAIAKGAKRAKSAFEGPLEVFSYGQAVFKAPPSGGKLATLTEFGQQPRFRGLRSSLYGLHCALLAAELVDGLTHEADAHPELFDIFVQFLSDVQEARGRAESLALLVLFELSLLQETGIQPMLKGCANCRRPFKPPWRQVYFSSSANGLICEDCEQAFPEKTRLSCPVGQTLSDLKGLVTAPEAVLNDVEKVLIYHFRELMHREPRMAKHLMK